MLEQSTIERNKMKRYRIFFLLVFAFCLFFSSCYYDVEEELYPDVNCDVENVGYTDTVIPILQTNCYSCHDAANNFGGITLEGYVQLKKYVENDQLLGVIRHETGYSPMPKNAPQLLECEIEKIEVWINNGAPNN